MNLLVLGLENSLETYQRGAMFMMNQLLEELSDEMLHHYCISFCDPIIWNKEQAQVQWGLSEALNQDYMDKNGSIVLQCSRAPYQPFWFYLATNAIRISAKDKRIVLGVLVPELCSAYDIAWS